MRVIPVFFGLLLLTSCAMPQPSGPPQAQERVGDPALDGKDYLLSEADFREIIRVVRASLIRETPWYNQIQRVHVNSATEVEVYVGGYNEFGDVARMVVRRKNRVWQSDGAAPILYVT